MFDSALAAQPVSIILTHKASFCAEAFWWYPSFPKVTLCIELRLFWAVFMQHLAQWHPYAWQGAGDSSTKQINSVLGIWKWHEELFKIQFQKVNHQVKIVNDGCDRLLGNSACDIIVNNLTNTLDNKQSNKKSMSVPT